MVIRTLDIGADKQADYFQLPQEENPAMGMRAIRLCLTRPEVFRTQLRALYRASAYGKIAILFPYDYFGFRSSADQENRCGCAGRIDRDAYPFDPAVELGIMIETPAAAVISDQLAPLVDFFSV